MTKRECVLHSGNLYKRRVGVLVRNSMRTVAVMLFRSSGLA